MIRVLVLILALLQGAVMMFTAAVFQPWVIGLLWGIFFHLILMSAIKRDRQVQHALNDVIEHLDNRYRQDSTERTEPQAHEQKEQS